MIIDGFHANTKDKCKQFLDNPSCLLLSNDTYYLGYGMYFWDSLEQAEWWRDTKKGGKNLAAIITAKIVTDNLLDITSKEVLDALDRLYNNIEAKLAESMSVNGTVLLGKKLDVLFTLCNKELQKYGGIYGVIAYKNRREHQFLQGSLMTMKPVAIILVKDYKIVSNVAIKD